MTQERNGRRGAVFSIRVTDEQREQLEALQRLGGGPRSLGPWLVWRALEAVPGVGTPPRPGSTHAGDGSTPPAGYYPLESVVPGPGTNTPAIAERIILDLCGGSGSWSQPYADVGYDVRVVTLPEQDVRVFAPPPGVWGVLAAPPCDQFSLARNGHPDLPRDFIGGLETVSACLRIISTCKPRWWALENPVGLLGNWLGTPRDVFEPCDFGDPWTKRTALWGAFRTPRRGPYVEPVGGGPLCTVCDPERRKTSWCSNAAHRAQTPPGFARAFFEANP